MAASARLQGDTVLVPDEKEASTLYNKGYFGTPKSGGGLVLDLAEALYLVENNRLKIERIDAAELLRHAAAREPDFEIRYVVYRDLRGRSFTVKPSNLTDFNLYPRGGVPGRAASASLVRCMSERGSLDVTALLDETARAAKHKKRLLVALVDEEGDLTYYEASEPDLRADVPALPRARATATLLADRVIVQDAADARALFEDGYFGRDVGLGLQLSLPEAMYLAESDRLRIVETDGKTTVAPSALAARARHLEPEFELRHALYRELRARGVVVKTGFKYGTHFRVYLGAPEEEHAPFLVHALPRERAVPWPEVAGFVRLAHGVRKKLYFAVRAEGAFRLLELERKRP